MQAKAMLPHGNVARLVALGCSTAQFGILLLIQHLSVLGLVIRMDVAVMGGMLLVV